MEEMETVVSGGSVMDGGDVAAGNGISPGGEEVLHPDANDICKMTAMVCEFELDSGFKKSVEFSPTYFALTIYFLGFLLKDGVLLCDPDEVLCSPEHFNVPPVTKVDGYKSMSLYMQFSDDTECMLELTPVQMLVLIVAFEFKCDEKAGVFNYISDEKAERKFLRNPGQFADLRVEGMK